MADSKSQTFFISGVAFNAAKDIIYTKPKVNAAGGKSIGILNASNMKGLYLRTPLMMTWGVNDFTDEASGRKTYDMSLQFPKEEYNNEQVQKFLDNMIAFEKKIKEDAITNCKDWMNKAKMSPEVIDALWNPMVKYPKDPNTCEADRSRPPTLRIKMPFWDGEWKCELYDMEQKMLFPNDNGLFPPELIAKATNVATVIQCGGLWFANGKFGVTWKLVQAVVKPKQSLRGKCFIDLSPDDKHALDSQAAASADDDEDHGSTGNKQSVVVVDSSDDEDEVPVVAKAVAPLPAPAPAPLAVPAVQAAAEVKQELDEAPAAKKKVVRKKEVAD